MLLKMIVRNLPLHTWRTFVDDDNRPSSSLFLGHNGQKNLDRIVDTIISGLTHDNTIELVAREWAELPSVVRMRVTQLANERYRNPSSHNQSKGIRKLDAMLKGAILKVEEGPTVRDLRVVNGQLTSTQRAVKPNVAGAERAYGGWVKPKDFDSWSASRKRRWHQEMSAARRNG